MADIRGKILSKYGFDPAQENIFKLYRLESADISRQELEEKIRETRKRWMAGVNGANEKNAARDAERLKKADSYEAVLKNEKLRKELGAFYNRKDNGSEGSAEFARQYFELVATTKKLRDTDVDFFFRYFPSERKNKKAVLEMLKKEMHIVIRDKKEKEEEEEKRKKTSDALIVNLFREETVLKLSRIFEKYNEVSGNGEIADRYPDIRKGLYEFIGADKVKDAEEFAEMISRKGKEVYAVRQEKGAEYVPLVDMFNILQELGGHKDVMDNMEEFKLLLKYPDLTPYMYLFVEMTPKTVRGMVETADRNHDFRNETDFLLNYYSPVHDNFGISNGRIVSMLRKAEKHAGQNKILKKTDKFLERFKRKGKIPVWVSIIHFLAYWPVFLMYLLFEAAEIIFTKLLHLTVIAVPVILIAAVHKLIPHLIPDGWNGIRHILRESLMTQNGGALFFMTLVLLILYAAAYIVLPFIGAVVMKGFVGDFNKSFDWIGIERTFRKMFSTLKKKTEEKYAVHKRMCAKSLFSKAFSNIAGCMLIAVSVTVLFPLTGKIAGNIGEKIWDTGSTVGENAKESETVSERENTEEENLPETAAPEKIFMVITEDDSNIRSGPGTEYDVLTVADSGEIFVATGRQETTVKGKIWYEIYLDEETDETGWASQKVIGFQ